MEEGKEFGHTEAFDELDVRSYQRSEASNNGGNELDDDLKDSEYGFHDGDENHKDGTCGPNGKDRNDVSHG